jgi:hypothetical protein
MVIKQEALLKICLIPGASSLSLEKLCLILAMNELPIPLPNASDSGLGSYIGLINGLIQHNLL